MVRLAIVGTGGMANTHAQNFRKLQGVELVGACDIDLGRAQYFAKQYEIPAAYQSVDEMLAELRCDAVSVVTNDATHKPVSLKALAAGKHVLCEKPLATNYPDAAEMVTAARAAGTINMINFSYRDSSAIHQAAQWIAAGELGRIYHVEAHYLQSWLAATDWGNWKTSPGWLWRLSTAHGSKGVLGDIGVHILDFASYPVGDVAAVRCVLKTFDKTPGGKVGEYTLDANDSAMITVEFANGALGSVTTTRLATGHQNSLLLTIHGEKGALRIDLDRSYQMIERCRLDDKTGTTLPWETLYTGKTPSIYQRFITSIETGTNDQPDFARGARVQKLLDACVESDASGQRVAV